MMRQLQNCNVPPGDQAAHFCLGTACTYPLDLHLQTETTAICQAPGGEKHRFSAQAQNPPSARCARRATSV